MFFFRWMFYLFNAATNASSINALRSAPTKPGVFKTISSKLNVGSREVSFRHIIVKILESIIEKAVRFCFRRNLTVFFQLHLEFLELFHDQIGQHVVRLDLMNLVDWSNQWWQHESLVNEIILRRKNTDRFQSIKFILILPSRQASNWVTIRRSISFDADSRRCEIASISSINKIHGEWR